MVRQTVKKGSQPKEENQDIIFMLSCIRSRENALIFFLELFAMASSHKLTQQQYQIYKNEFLQKQKINSSQIKTILEKIHTVVMPQNQIKSFWIKLKSIIRVSLERARTLGMLSDTLTLCYQQIIKLIDGFYSASSGLKEYLQIQQLVKRRTIQALMATKQALSQHPSQDFGKIRSQTFLKAPDSLSYSPGKMTADPITSMQEVVTIKESNRIRRKQKTKIKPFDLKKIHYSLCRYSTNLADVMDMRIDYHLDKKKTQAENTNSMYDTMFSKNINNHKIIAKYTHNCQKAMKKLVQLKRAQSQRRNMSYNTRIAKRGIIESTQTLELGKLTDSKQKLVRPKTSKQTKKTVTLKGSQSKPHEKIYDLIKII